MSINVFWLIVEMTNTAKQNRNHATVLFLIISIGEIIVEYGKLFQFSINNDYSTEVEK